MSRYVIFIGESRFSLKYLCFVLLKVFFGSGYRLSIFIYVVEVKLWNDVDLFRRFCPELSYSGTESTFTVVGAGVDLVTDIPGYWYC